MNEANRIRQEYERRAGDKRYWDRYSPFNRADLYLAQERERGVLEFLDRFRTGRWPAYQVLDVGCGNGDQLVKFAALGIPRRNLTGADLLLSRLVRAGEKYAGLSLACANGGALPFATSSFDLVLQFTVFTSILEGNLRQQVATEILRVLRPGGLILWYDYRLNPTNRQTRGIGAHEVRRLFPECTFLFRRITLAPPLARIVAKRSWFLYVLLSQMPFLRSHYLVAIQRARR